MTTGESRRNPYVDVLRGLCILVVMLLHYALAYRLHDSPLNRWVSVDTLKTIFFNGNYGVSVFFVISGFLITLNTMRRYGDPRDTDIGHFYKLRLFRLYPSVVLALAIITSLGLAGWTRFVNANPHTDFGDGFFVLGNLSVLTFWHNLLMQRVGYFNYAMNVYWSLSVEEVFYLVYPLLLVFVRRRGMLIALALAGVVAAPVYRAIHRDDELFFMYGNLACLDMLIYGCAAAVLAERARLSPKVRQGIALLGLIAMGWVYMRGIGGHEAWGATQIGLAAAVFLVAVHHLPARRWARRAMAPLAWLGSHSYELYLFHIIVLGAIQQALPKAAMTATLKLPVLILFLALSALVSWAVARFYGDPLNRVLRRRYARRTRGTAQRAMPAREDVLARQDPG